MPTDINKGFDNGDLLRDIRVDILNPVTVKVRELETRIGNVKETAEHAFNSVIVDYDNQSLDFHGVQGGGVANLTGMFKEGVDLSVQGGSGPVVDKITKIRYVDSSLKRNSAGDVDISYDWKGIVEAYQVPLQVGTIADGTKATKHLFFRGAKQVVYSTGDITTIDITPTDSMTASIPGKGIVNPVAIKTIELEGETDSSELRDGKLTIHMNKGGGSGTVTNQNFKGFFDTLGELISNVTDALNGKSFAYVKDSKLGANYYTAYWYVSNNWTELKQDPALLYTAPSSPTPSGVFSIKPNPGISVDANGQLDLDGLSTPQTPSYFVGFFNSLDELKTAVPRPVPYQTCAYVKGPGGGWLNYRAEKQGTASLWRVVAPLGSFSLVNEGASTYSQVFGINKQDSWDVDGRGLLTLKPINTKTKAEIVDYKGDVVTGEFNTIQFRSGKSYVNLYNGKLFLDHPQQIIQYDSEFESDHNTQNYEGNIFYDENSKTWMGWGIPSTPGGVDKKWTRIIHPKMSDEVKDLSKRCPAKSPSVEGGILGDSRLWDYNGFTYVEKDSEILPDELKNVCGGYVTTIIQDKDDPSVTIPQNRMQSLVADTEGGATYIRRFLSAASPGSATSWSPWVRTSFSKKDINAHETDPAAHKTVIKYHRASSFTSKFSEFVNQVGPDGSKGVVRDDNCDLLVDNYGFSPSTDYIEVPYDGKFRIKGEIAFSGYKGNTTVTTWKVILLIAHKNQPGNYQLLRQFQHVHSKTSERYPPMFFSVEDQALEPGDKVYIKVQSTDMNAIVTNHPNLYFVPVKSYFVIEDQETRSGSKIANTHKKHLANLNALGDIEVKAHHNDYDSTKAVRVYGDKVNKTSVEMRPVT